MQDDGNGGNGSEGMVEDEPIVIKANREDGTEVLVRLRLPDMASAPHISRVKARFETDTDVLLLDTSDAEQMITGLNAFLASWAKEVQSRRRKNWSKKP